MSKAYSKVFFSSLLFIASIIGWGLSMRNAEASSSGVENMLAENTSIYSKSCKSDEVSNEFVRFYVDDIENMVLMFDTKDDHISFDYNGWHRIMKNEGSFVVEKYKKRENFGINSYWIPRYVENWEKKDAFYKRYYQGQHNLELTAGVYKKDLGVRYKIWWTPDGLGEIFMGEIECSWQRA